MGGKRKRGFTMDAQSTNKRPRLEVAPDVITNDVTYDFSVLNEDTFLRLPRVTLMPGGKIRCTLLKSVDFIFRSTATQQCAVRAGVLPGAASLQNVAWDRNTLAIIRTTVITSGIVQGSETIQVGRIIPFNFLLIEASANGAYEIRLNTDVVTLSPMAFWKVVENEYNVDSLDDFFMMNAFNYRADRMAGEMTGGH
jgi:hypothetical protein